MYWRSGGGGRRRRDNNCAEFQGEMAQTLKIFERCQWKAPHEPKAHSKRRRKKFHYVRCVCGPPTWCVWHVRGVQVSWRRDVRAVWPECAYVEWTCATVSVVEVLKCERVNWEGVWGSSKGWKGMFAVFWGASTRLSFGCSFTFSKLFLRIFLRAFGTVFCSSTQSQRRWSKHQREIVQEKRKEQTRNQKQRAKTTTTTTTSRNHHPLSLLWRSKVIDISCSSFVRNRAFSL